MTRVLSIKAIEPYFLVCRFNNNSLKKLDILPLIQSHKKLNGIEQLMDSETFKKARVGEMGEILWDKIITTNYNGEEVIWDYDISPEFAFENGIQC